MGFIREHIGIKDLLTGVIKFRIAIFASSFFLFFGAPYVQHRIDFSCISIRNSFRTIMINWGFLLSKCETQKIILDFPKILSRCNNIVLLLIATTINFSIHPVHTQKPAEKTLFTKI